MTKELNEFYKSTPAFYEIEDSWDGFEWLAADDSDRNFLAYQRNDREGNTYVVMINFSGSDLENYRLGVPKGKYQVIFNSDSVRYGGTGSFNKRVFNTKKSYSHGKDTSIAFDLPKMTCVYLKKIN
jgi:1,4-alpha-glucan branching enzyme